MVLLLDIVSVLVAVGLVVGGVLLARRYGPARGGRARLGDLRRTAGQDAHDEVERRGG